MKKHKFILTALLLLCFSGKIYAQETETPQQIPDNAVRDYLSNVSEYSPLFNGKVELSYGTNMKTLPYWIEPELAMGTLIHNGIKYTDIQMRMNSHRDELIMKLPNSPINIVLESEKVNEAHFHGTKVLSTHNLNWDNMPSGKYLIVVHEGKYPVLKRRDATMYSRINDKIVEYSFNIRERFYVCIDNICYPIRNKKSLLNLFPDKKRELDQFARQHKLNFRKKPDEAFSAMVNHYENISR